MGNFCRCSYQLPIYQIFLDFRVQVEECLYALAKLGFDFFFASFKDVHGDVSGASISQLNGSFSNLGDFSFREKAHSVDKSQFCHASILSNR